MTFPLSHSCICPSDRLASVSPARFKHSTSECASASRGGCKWVIFPVSKLAPCRPEKTAHFVPYQSHPPSKTAEKNPHQMASRCGLCGFAVWVIFFRPKRWIITHFPEAEKTHIIWVILGFAARDRGQGLPPDNSAFCPQKALLARLIRSRSGACKRTASIAL